MVCEVIVNVNTSTLDKTFDYLVPEEDITLIKVGARVLVNFNNRHVIGYVLSLKEESQYKGLKEIISLIDIVPILNEEQMSLVKYLKTNYYTTYLKAIDTILGGNTKIDIKTVIKVINKDNLSSDLKTLLKRKDNLYTKKFLSYQKEIDEAVKNKDLAIELVLKDTKLQEESYYTYLNSDIKTTSSKSLELLNYLKETKSSVSKTKLKELGFSLANIKLLLDKGAIIETKEEKFKEVKVLGHELKELTLTSEQDLAINKVSLDKYVTYLLYGVTGSGKTLVYIELIKKVLKEGREVIILVPEISLTPQMASIFKKIFGDTLAIMHSKLSRQEKISEYLRIKNGHAKLVLGPRSAIFMPFTNLGLVIVDEEQEQTYTQEQSPCYDARDIARLRAEFYDAPLILGTATPRVSSYYLAQTKKYELLTLTKRPTNTTLPTITLVDMKEELHHKNNTTISYLLAAKIKEKLEKNEQVILFYNKRGYASSVMCRDCGHVILCPNCQMPLTYHKNKNKLTCHLCGYETKNVDTCPKCHSKKIRYVGLGTEKITGDLAKLFPKARLYRVDSDSVGSDYNLFYEKIKKHEVDIVIGTQMIAKGLDFPDVTLVGVINADLGFFYPVYDAFESNYALLEQVCGRSGRHKKGEVIIQTYNPDNYVLEAVKKHSYEAFYEEEIKKRDMLSYPPFKKIIKLTLSGPNSDIVFKEASLLADKLKNLNLTILGPTKAIYFVINNIYHYDIYLKYDTIKMTDLTKYLDVVKVYVKLSYL